MTSATLSEDRKSVVLTTEYHVKKPHLDFIADHNWTPGEAIRVGKLLIELGQEALRRQPGDKVADFKESDK